MARGLLERVLNPDLLDEWFDSTSKEQYTRNLLFSTVFDLMSKVVSSSYKSVHTVYRAAKNEISFSLTSIYNKINGIEPGTSAELVRFASAQFKPVIRKLGGTLPYLLPRKRIKLTDGNSVEKGQHCIKETRTIAAGPLPEK